MAIAELKEALQLLSRMPLLWIPGVVGGLLAALLWILLNISGTFFAGRLVLITGLVVLLFTTGMLTLIKDNGGDAKALFAGGIRYYFRVLLPQLVIIFFIMLIVVLVAITFGFAGATPDIGVMTALTFCIMVPTVIFTSFYDTAAVFEDRRVFDSIRRSIALVMNHFNEVIAFFLVCAALSFAIFFALMLVWEAFLYDNLEPITRYNETQLQAFTPDQLVSIIGPGGMWITAVVLFIGVLVLIPLLYTYKACFFRHLAGRKPTNTLIQQQVTTGEYDSKGRWYKY